LTIWIFAFEDQKNLHNFSRNPPTKFDLSKNSKSFFVIKYRIYVWRKVWRTNWYFFWMFVHSKSWKSVLQLNFICTRILLSLQECHECSAAAISAFSAPWATRLLWQWMPLWWRVNGSTAREQLLCTHSLTLSTWPDKPVSTLEWLVWESNTA